MYVRTRVLIALAGALFALSAAPAAAQMSVAVKVFEDYATDGVLDPCKHTSAELREVQKNIPPDIEQYAPDYPSAIEAALEARARGDCSGKKSQSPAKTPAATVTPSPTPAATATPVPTEVPTRTVVDDPPEPETLASATAATPTATPSAARADLALERVATARPANGAPLPVLALAVLGAALLAGLLFLLAARRFGWGEERFAGPLHSWREATWRASGVWQDFRDWLRLGR